MWYGFSKCDWQFYYFQFLLVLNCSDTTYLLKTVTVLRQPKDDITSSSKVIPVNVNAIQKSFESKFIGAVTYVQNGGDLYRAYLDGNENIQTVLVAKIPTQTDPIVIDAVLTDFFVLVRFSNARFQLYVLPNQPGGMLLSPNEGSLENQQIPYFHYFYPTDSTLKSFQLWISPNYNTGNNILQIYNILLTFNEEGLLSNIKFELSNNIDIQDSQISSMDLSSDLIVIGCQFCKDYNGRIDIFSRSTNQKLFSKEGNADNRQFGYDLKMLQREDYTTIYINSNNLAPVKNYYLNVIKIIKTTEGQYGVDIVEKLVDLSSSEKVQGGLQIGIYLQQVLFKYVNTPTFYSLTTCDYNNYYIKQDAKCMLCPSNQFTLSVQQDLPCTQCSQLYNQRKTNSYKEVVYDQKCDWYKPSNPNDGNNTDNNTLPNDQNKTIIVVDDKTGKGNGNGWKIAVGVVIPIVVIVAGIIIFICCKKKCIGEKTTDDEIESKEAKKVEERSQRQDKKKKQSETEIQLQKNLQGVQGGPDDYQAVKAVQSDRNFNTQHLNSFSDRSYVIPKEELAIANQAVESKSQDIKKQESKKEEPKKPEVKKEEKQVEPPKELNKKDTKKEEANNKKKTERKSERRPGGGPKQQMDLFAQLQQAELLAAQQQKKQFSKTQQQQKQAAQPSTNKKTNIFQPEDEKLANYTTNKSNNIARMEKQEEAKSQIVAQRESELTYEDIDIDRSDSPIKAIHNIQMSSVKDYQKNMNSGILVKEPQINSNQKKFKEANPNYSLDSEDNV